MEVSEVFLKCLLCPGICTVRCPVYLETRYTPSRPVNIARALYRFHISGDEGFLKASGFCTLCGECREACPVDNDLPGLIKWFRRRLIDPPPKIDALEGDVIYVAEPYTEEVVIEGSVYKLVDSWKIYRAVSYGYMDRGSLEAGYTEDLDSFAGPTTLDLFLTLGIRLELGRYVLHLPCKAEDELAVKASKVFGEPEKVVRRCLGGGGLDLIDPELQRRFGPLEVETPVLTPCSRSALRLRSMGIEAYTPLEVYLKWNA